MKSTLINSVRSAARNLLDSSILDSVDASIMEHSVGIPTIYFVCEHTHITAPADVCGSITNFMRSKT
jgi:hypothetical protein